MAHPFAVLMIQQSKWCNIGIFFIMKAKKLDQKFDNGDDILDFLDLSRAKRVMQDQKRVDGDFPVWMLELLDKEASRIGVTRQSIIKVWLAERLEQLAANKALQRTNR